LQLKDFMAILETRDFTLLKWDSELFGFYVARLHPDCINGNRLERAIMDLHTEGIRLAYATLPWSDDKGRVLLDRAGAFMADRKILFKKQLSYPVRMPEGVEIWPGPECSLELEALALASGHYSRFRLDPQIPSHVFPNLYAQWIQRSVRGEIADVVLVAKENGILAGMVTLTVDGEIGNIGLIAVAEGSRGLGIGRRLMVAAEAFCAARKSRWLQVVTQGTNQAACALYTACGFELAEENAVYHIWVA
jgi:dTDP-4-amino-4,6-dideoxy-D-galactose acyltransferase